jgi:hypothetical protein
MGNAKLSSEAISLEISKKGLLEFFFFFFERNSLFSLKSLLQKKAPLTICFLGGRKEGKNTQAKCALNSEALDSVGGLVTRILDRQC